MKEIGEEPIELRQLLDSVKTLERRVQGKGYIPTPRRRPQRVDRRPRLTWPCWLNDWLQALRATGWTCCNRIKLPRNAKLGKATMRKLDTLYMHRKGVVVCLHPDPCNLPDSFVLSDEIDLNSKRQVKAAFHIVRGNRKTWRYHPEAPFPYAIEINGALYDTFWKPDWLKCHDKEINTIFAEYLSASLYHEATRNYQNHLTYSKRLAAKRSTASNGLLAHFRSEVVREDARRKALFNST